MIIVALLLAGCASDSTTDDRRFANDPVTAQPTEPATVEPTVNALQTETAPKVQPALEDLLTASGAPETAFVMSGGKVLAVTPDLGRGAVALNTPYAPVALDQSPDGSGVAILSWSDAGFRVDLMDASNAILRSWTNVADLGSPAAQPLASPAVASPAANATAAYPGAISFAPDGKSLLVTTGSLQVVAIDLDGGIERFDLPNDIAGIESAQWSPKGDVVAVLARDVEGLGQLWTFAPHVDGSGLRLLVPGEGDDNAGSVQAFDWLPDGDGVLLLMADKGDSTQPGGQLYSLSLDGDHRELVGSAGRIGPAARIVDFAISPDGRSIAYAIVIPNARSWEFDSLWVRSLADATTYEIPIGDVRAISSFTWVQGGVVLVRESGSGADVLFVPASGGQVTFSLDGGAGTPSSTPDQASPVTGDSPIVATPEATPVSGTPVASPSGAPPVATPADTSSSPATTPIRG